MIDYYNFKEPITDLSEFSSMIMSPEATGKIFITITKTKSGGYSACIELDGTDIAEDG
ncbi:MAG: hypothetical protein J6X66_06555 [Lachnospiraceae bacterium]|nr:hypothetical protein [Lachnospiraceae bacterium]